MCVSVGGGSVTSGQNVTAWSTCHMVYSMSHTDEMSQGDRTVTSRQNVTSWKTCHMVDRISHMDELSTVRVDKITRGEKFYIGRKVT